MGRRGPPPPAPADRWYPRRRIGPADRRHSPVHRRRFRRTTSIPTKATSGASPSRTIVPSQARGVLRTFRRTGGDWLYPAGTRRSLEAAPGGGAAAGSCSPGQPPSTWPSSGAWTARSSTRARRVPSAAARPWRDAPAGSSGGSHVGRDHLPPGGGAVGRLGPRARAWAAAVLQGVGARDQRTRSERFGVPAAVLRPPWPRAWSGSRSWQPLGTEVQSTP